MKVRFVAGSGMALLAVGLMTIYFLSPDFPESLWKGTEPEESASRPPAATDSPAEVDEFLARFNATYRSLWTDATGAEWTALTHLSAENEAAGAAAQLKLDEFTGSHAVVSQLQLYRDRLDLSELQDRQIEAAWRLASDRPYDRGAESDRIRALVESAAASGAAADSWTTRMTAATDTAGRRALWEERMAAGLARKDTLLELRDLRNDLARRMGYASHFDREAAELGLAGDELLALLDETTARLGPLYGQLHCWVKHELARRYGAAVPLRMPIHWLNDAQGARWSGVIEAPDLDTGFADVQPAWNVEQAERFYISLGFAPLPLAFWGRSDLYPLPAEADRRKSAADVSLSIDLQQDVRSLLHVRNDHAGYRTAHRHLGAVYCLLATDTPDVPPVLRTGPARVVASAIGAWGELAADQVPALHAAGVLPRGEAPEEIRRLMSEALGGVVVAAPFRAGALAHWEHELYADDLPRHHFNTSWWENVARYQGLEAPAPRGEDNCDPALYAPVLTGTANVYRSLLAELIGHQVHRYLCREILRQDVRTADYAGNRRVGVFLHSLMQPGAARGWMRIVRQATGKEPSADALVEYYAPLLEWLQAQNEGRDVSF